MVKKFIGIFGVIFTLGLLNSEAVRADQTGNCTAGSEYCEQNSLTTTNATTTTNTNNNNTTTTSTSTNTNKLALGLARTGHGARSQRPFRT